MKGSLNGVYKGCIIKGLKNGSVLLARFPLKGVCKGCTLYKGCIGLSYNKWEKCSGLRVGFRV